MELKDKLDEIQTIILDAISSGTDKFLAEIKSVRAKTRALIAAAAIGTTAGVSGLILANSSKKTPDSTEQSGNSNSSHAHTHKTPKSSITSDTLHVSPKKTQKESLANYSPEAVRYAKHVISNGKKISSSPDKEKEIEKTRLHVSEGMGNTNPLKLFGYCNEDRETGQIAAIYEARKTVSDLPSKYSLYLPVEFIIATLSNEGFSLDLDSPKTKNLDGFENFGNDTFGSEYKRMVAAGVIPPNFQDKFSITKRYNEKGIPVISARFNDKTAAIQATVSMLAYNQTLFYDDLVARNIPTNHLTPDERLFYTYYYYNRGPNSIDKELVSEEIVHRRYYSFNNQGASANAYRVVGGVKWMTINGVTDKSPEGKYWWSRSTQSGENLEQTKLEKALNQKISPHSIDGITFYVFDQARVTAEWYWLLSKAREEGWKGGVNTINKGMRTYAQQKSLYEAYLHHKGSPAFNPDGPKAAHAMHLIKNVKAKGNWSMAIDTDANEVDKLIKIAEKLGVKLHRPYMPQEPWHIEAVEEFAIPE